jgi:hypothetical protein
MRLGGGMEELTACAVRRCEYEDTLCEWALVCGNSLFVSRKELSACGSREPPNPADKLPFSQELCFGSLVQTTMITKKFAKSIDISIKI